MFENIEGVIVLADWAIRGELRRRCVPNSRLRYNPDGIFSAVKGNVRYVVVDGLVGEGTIAAILDQVPPGEIVQVWATQFDDAAASKLRRELPGSRWKRFLIRSWTPIGARRLRDHRSRAASRGSASEHDRGSRGSVMPGLNVDGNLLAEIRHRLTLRDPNAVAVESVANVISQHYDVDSGESPLEMIVVSATGVGKTYVMAGIMDYLAGTDDPARNFLLLAPGRTIRDKSINNFTPGHPKSITAFCAQTRMS